MTKKQELVKKFRTIEEKLKAFIFERDDEIHGLNLSILSGNNMLCLGAPGIAKSYMIDNYVKFIKDYNYFKIQLTKFSTPEELLGPFSIPALKNGEFKRVTKNKLPEAHVVFIDEIFKANSGILNSLLLAINEREFINDGIVYKIPMLSLIAASNEIPSEEDGLTAMYDRMVLKYVSLPIQETGNFIKMLNSKVPKIEPIISLEEIYEARTYVNEVKLGAKVEETLSRIRNKFKEDGISVTDRTFKLSVKLLQAEAFLNARDEISLEDFDILQHSLWSDIDQRKKIYSIIISLTYPIKHKIIELLANAEEICNNLLAQDNETKKMMQAVEATKKLKDITNTILSYVQEAKSVNKDVSDLEVLVKKAEGYMNKCINAMGVDVNKIIK